MTNADYADDLAFISNTTAQVKSVLYCLVPAAGKISS